MKPTDPPPPQASARQAPPPPQASAPQGPPQPGPSGRGYDDGVVHHRLDDGQGHDDSHNDGVAHEHSDVDVRAIVMSTVILTVVCVVSQVLMYLLFGWFEREAAANDRQLSPLAIPATEMPKTTTGSPFFTTGVNGPQLLTNEPMALQKFRAGQTKRMGEYGWVNEATGVAHMPIDAAKKLLLERGLPVREGATPASFSVRPQVRGESSGGRTVTVDLPDRAATPAQQTPVGHGQPASKPQGGGH